MTTKKQTLYSTLQGLALSFFRYMIAGGMGFVLDYGIFAFCHEVLGVYYLLSAALGFVAGLVFVYISSNKWVFKQRKMENRQAVEFSIFALIGIAGLGFTLLFMWIFTDLCHIDALISKLITTALVLLWNFGARKVILY